MHRFGGSKSDSSMALSAKLQLRQSQSLVMTPQLMQSIKLLQFTHAELERFIDEEIERNPLLERVEPQDDAATDQIQKERAKTNASDDWYETDGLGQRRVDVRAISTRRWRTSFRTIPARRNGWAPTSRRNGVPPATGAGGDSDGFDLEDIAAAQASPCAIMSSSRSPSPLPIPPQADRPRTGRRAGRGRLFPRRHG